MSANVKPTYYRLELDDYSAAAFTSFGKYYYGTLEDLRCFFGELAHDEKLKKQFKGLLFTFQAFEEGHQDLSHSIAYRKVSTMRTSPTFCVLPDGLKCQS